MHVVTLLSDFGTADGYVGAMKGVILARAPGATVVDISHDIARHDIAAGGFALSQAAPLFPAGTIHVAVVDPGVGGKRRAVVAVDERHVFIGPDNGLLRRAVPRPVEVFEIAHPSFLRAPVSSTFHGRDVFAAAAGHIAAGAAPRDAGPAVAKLAAGPTTSAEPSVVHVDGFGNLITNLPAADVPVDAGICVAGRTIRGLSATYASVEPGQLLAYIGSGDTIEIAVREGSAATLLRVGRGAPVDIERNGQ